MIVEIDPVKKAFLECFPEKSFIINAADFTSEWCFMAPSENSPDKAYMVSKDKDFGYRCTCPDFTYRRLQGRIGVHDSDECCKHVAAVLDLIDEVVELFVALVEEEKRKAAVTNIHELQRMEVYVHG